MIAKDAAVIESAQVVGLTDASATGHPVEARSTRGLGELIRILLDAGVKRLLVGVGGSSTNDGGAGLLADRAEHLARLFAAARTRSRT